MNLTHSPSSPHDASGLLFAGFNQVPLSCNCIILRPPTCQLTVSITCVHQDFGCFAVGLRNGFRVFNADPLVQQTRKGKPPPIHVAVGE